MVTWQTVVITILALVCFWLFVDYQRLRNSGEDLVLVKLYDAERDKIVSFIIRQRDLKRLVAGCVEVYYQNVAQLIGINPSASQVRLITVTKQKGTCLQGNIIAGEYRGEFLWETKENNHRLARGVDIFRLNPASYLVIWDHNERVSWKA